MRIHFVIAAPLLLWATAAAAQVTVAFVKPDRYTDAGATAADRKETMAGIERHLKRLGEQYIAGRTLKIEVLDIDLAGRLRYGGRDPKGVRVVERTDPPVIKLRYSLESGGKAGETRHETVSDRDFLETPGAPGNSDSLYYEKHMLDEWFRARFAQDAVKR